MNDFSVAIFKSKKGRLERRKNQTEGHESRSSDGNQAEKNATTAGHQAEPDEQSVLSFSKNKP